MSYRDVSDVELVALRQKFPGLRRLKSPPTLVYFKNSTGLGLVEHEEARDTSTGLFVSLRAFLLLSLPIIHFSAYLVGRDHDGRYFVGKLPLPFRAWLQNSLVLGLVAGVMLLGVQAYEHPERAIREALAEARAVADRGEVAHAARAFAELSNQAPVGDEAAAAFRLLVEECVEEGELAHAAIALRAGALASTGFRILHPADIVHLVSQVDEHLPGDPEGALLFLNQLSRYDAKSAEPKREAWVRAAYATAPNLPLVASEMARLLEMQGELEKAGDALASLENELDPLSEAARIYGLSLLAKGRVNDAIRRLEPYVDDGLNTLTQAARTYDELYDRGLAILHTGRAQTQAWYDAYRRADERQKSKMVDDYMRGRAETDPQTIAAVENLERAQGITPTALELVRAYLTSAPAAKEPKDAKNTLMKADTVMERLHKHASNQVPFRLLAARLAQAHGRRDEAHSIVKKMLSAGPPSSVLVQLVDVLQALDLSKDVQRVAREGYASAQNEEQKYQFARAIASQDLELDERIAWLSRCDPDDAFIQAKLLEYRGRKAWREGDAEAARGLYQAALERHQKLKASSSQRYRMAQVRRGLFETGGGYSQLEGFLAGVREAQTLDGNMVPADEGWEVAEARAVARVAGPRIDFGALAEMPRLHHLRLLAKDERERRTVWDRLRSGADFQAAVEAAERYLEAAPASANAYRPRLDLLQMAPDAAALDTLSAALGRGELEHGSAADVPDTEEATANRGRAAASTTLAARREAVRQTIERFASASVETQVAALARLVAVEVELFATGSPVAVKELIQALDKRLDTRPSLAGREARIRALSLRALRELSKASPRVAALVDALRTELSPRTLLAWLLNPSSPAPVRRMVAKHRDVKRIQKLVLVSCEADLEACGPASWSLLKSTNGRKAARLAAQLRANKTLQRHRNLRLRLMPPTAEAHLFRAWEESALGRRQGARAALAEARASGLKP